MFISNLRLITSYQLPIYETQHFGGLYKQLSNMGKDVTNGLSCYSCGDTFTKSTPPSVDHLIPVSHKPGGRKVKENNEDSLGLMCQPCNRDKSATPFLDYAQENPQVIGGLRKQAEQISSNPKMRKIAEQQKSLADKASYANRKSWLG